MKNPKLFIIGHPDDGTYVVNFDQLAQAAAENRVLLELNEASVAPDSYRLNGRENALQMLKACKRWKTRVILSSDAHVGERDNGRETKDSVRDGKGVETRRLLYGQFPQISAKNEKQKLI